MKKTQTLVFDGDDTLWYTQPLYDQAISAFLNLLASEGYNREDVTNKFSEVDIANVNVMGLSRYRFPYSMRETYTFFCRIHHREPKADIVEIINRIGSSVFHAKPELANHVLEVLRLLSNSYNLILYTAGDEEVQWSRIQKSGLLQYFDNVCVTARKDQAAFQMLIEKYGLDVKHTWMIGNSVRSDINPALAQNVRCIWVNSHSWHYEEERLLPGAVWKADSLEEIPNILDSQNNCSKSTKLHQCNYFW